MTRQAASSGSPAKAGHWCVHCETAWENGRIAFLGDSIGCPREDCDGWEYDLWPIEGAFEHGERVDAGSERLAELRSDQ